jgi:hypothetical protein
METKLAIFKSNYRQLSFKDKRIFSPPKMAEKIYKKMATISLISLVDLLIFRLVKSNNITS